MSVDRILGEVEWTSVVMRETAARVNFIWRLAVLYRAPEPLAFVDALAKGLECRKIEGGPRTSPPGPEPRP